MDHCCLLLSFFGESCGNEVPFFTEEMDGLYF